MALDAEVIREVLLTPKVKQPSGTGYEDGCEVWAGERIALVVHPAGRVVVTILWRASHTNAVRTRSPIVTKN